jgi:hypothetical protein
MGFDTSKGARAGIHSIHTHRRVLAADLANAAEPNLFNGGHQCEHRRGGESQAPGWASNS